MLLNMESIHSTVPNHRALNLFHLKREKPEFNNTVEICWIHLFPRNSFKVKPLPVTSNQTNLYVRVLLHFKTNISNVCMYLVCLNLQFCNRCYGYSSIEITLHCIFHVYTHIHTECKQTTECVKIYSFIWKYVSSFSNLYLQCKTFSGELLRK